MEPGSAQAGQNARAPEGNPGNRTTSSCRPLHGKPDATWRMQRFVLSVIAELVGIRAPESTMVVRSEVCGLNSYQSGVVVQLTQGQSGVPAVGLQQRKGRRWLRVRASRVRNSRPA